MKRIVAQPDFVPLDNHEPRTVQCEGSTVWHWRMVPNWIDEQESA